MVLRPRRSKTAEERFWPKVDKRGPDECWPWIGSLTPNGYGYIGMVGGGNGRNMSAHRVSYELAKGPIPDGLTIDHVCHNADLSCNASLECPHRRCVNPAHLEAVRQRTNTLRGRNFIAELVTRTHCPRGHAYDEANTYITKRGERMCRACHREKAAERKARRRAESSTSVA